MLEEAYLFVVPVRSDSALASGQFVLSGHLVRVSCLGKCLSTWNDNQGDHDKSKV
jgi:hypothetical protein